jgi:hypothetical protein
MADRTFPMPAPGSEPYTLPTHARLVDGSVVPLVKDCSCVVHEGPCWLNYDHIVRTQNRRLLASIRAQAARPTDPGSWAFLCDAYVHEELARVREKRREMERRGIAGLLYAEPAADTEVRHAG